MQDKSGGMCYLCMKLHGDYHRRSDLEEHHVIYGKGRRKLSERYGLKVYLCHQHHNDESCTESVHYNKELRQYLCRDAQRAFEEYPKFKVKNLDFRAIFGESYLESRPKQEKKASEAAGFIFLEE